MPRREGDQQGVGEPAAVRPLAAMTAAVAKVVIEGARVPRVVAEPWEGAQLVAVPAVALMEGTSVAATSAEAVMGTVATVACQAAVARADH